MNTVPIIIENVTLKIDVEKSDVNAAESWKEQLQLIKEIKEKFGADSLLDKLTALIPGSIKRIQIIPGEVPAEPAPPPKPYDPNYKLETYRFKGEQIENISPDSLFQILNQDPFLFTPNDLKQVTLYKQYLELNPKPKPRIEQIIEDDIPY